MSADIVQSVGGPTSFIQTTDIAPIAGGINFTKTDNIVNGLFVATFSPAQNVKNLIVTSALTTGPGSDLSSQLNTFIQSSPTRTTPEPAVVQLLGIGLAGLALAFRRKRA
jgi:hypothetical protein